MPNDRLIRSFLVLGETLSYTRAAESLFLSHQALSQQITRLEEELGHRLFVRTTRSVALTAEGELFYAYFKDERRRYAEVCLEAERLARIRQTDLRIGFPLGIQPPEFFTALARDFREQHNGRSIRMEWHDVDALTQLFQSGTLDLVFSLDDSGLGASSQVESVQVCQCRMVLVAARDHPGWQGSSLSAFSDETFYYERESTPESTNEMRRTMEEALCEAGIQRPNIELVPNIQSRQIAVELGAGCCLSVDLDILCANPLVRMIPLDRPSSHLSCFWRKNEEKTIVVKFVTQIKQIFNPPPAPSGGAFPDQGHT